MGTIYHRIEEQNKFAYKEIIFESWKKMKDYLFLFSSRNEKGKYIFRGGMQILNGNCNRL